MENFTAEQWRFYVFARSKLGENAAQIHRDLECVMKEQCPSYRTVARWIESLKAGRDSLEDDPRSGRPSTAVTEDIVDRVRVLVQEDPHVTIAVLSQEVGVSEGSVHSILHNHLRLRKICARWVPHLLTDDQKRERVRCSRYFLSEFVESGRKRLSDIVTGDEKWFFYFQVPHKHQNKTWVAHGDPRPTVLRASFRSRKQMFVVFVTSSGPLEVVMVPKGQNVNATFYTTQVLPRVMASINDKAPERLRTGRILLHHDNASSHTAALTRKFIDENRLKIVPHPPYSPDLALLDFWVFPKLSERMAGCNFSREQDLARRINSELKAIPPSEYQEAYQSWIHRHQKCVANGGGYVEGL